MTSKKMLLHSFQGEELSEEFQEKARTIFETAIKTKVATKFKKS